MNTNEDRSLDAVLFRFHQEVAMPTPEVIAAWRRAYPEHATEIEAHAVELLDLESRVNAEVRDIESLEAKARSAGLNAVYEAKQRRAAAPARSASLRETAAQAGVPLRDLADRVGIARSIVFDVDTGAIPPETVIVKFLQAVSEILGQSVATLQETIAQPRQAGMSSSTAFKASAPPTAGKTRTWREAVLASDMTEEKRAYWLSEED